MLNSWLCKGDYLVRNDAVPNASCAGSSPISDAKNAPKSRLEGSKLPHESPTYAEAARMRRVLRCQNPPPGAN